MKNNQGFTLIELIIVISIGSILITAAFGIYNVGRSSHDTVVEEFEKQSSIRHSIEIINKTVRFATVGFAVTADDFKPEADGNDYKGLVKPWHYIGLSPTGDAFVHYRWVDDGSANGKYEIDVLAEAPEGVTFEMSFEKSERYPESNLMKYNLAGEKSGSPFFDLETEIEALNALQVIDWGDTKNKAVALAYRNEETPEIEEIPTPVLTMVIDKSGSMGYALDRSQSKTNLEGDNPERMVLLKDTLTNDEEGILTILEDTEAYISIVPFSSNGDDYSDFYNVTFEKSDLESEILDLSPNGATNTGDGLRQAYYQLIDFNENIDDYITSDSSYAKNYVVLLVDGETSAATVRARRYGSRVRYNRSNPEFKLDTGKINRSFVWPSIYSVNTNVNDDFYPTGEGNSLDTTLGIPYIDLVGEMILDSNNVTVDKSFIIGYSNDSGNLRDIAEPLGILVTDQDESEDYMNNDQIFLATDRESLKQAFEDIGNYIKEDLWQVSGPKLNE